MKRYADYWKAGRAHFDEVEVLERIRERTLPAKLAKRDEGKFGDWT